MALQGIDVNKDNIISSQEIKKAVKPNGFLSKPENVQKLTLEIENNKEEIIGLLKEPFDEYIHDFLSTNSSPINQADIRLINIWNQWFGKESTHLQQQLIQKLKEKVSVICTYVNKKIAGNKLKNSNYYSKEQVMGIQLYVNLKYGENLNIDGERVNSQNRSGLLFDLSAQTENQKLTNLYIYKQELATRGQIIDIRKNNDKLLNIPNIEGILEAIGDKNTEKKVLAEFLDFFLGIRRKGFYFENEVGSENLEKLFVGMVNREVYKNHPINTAHFPDQNTEATVSQFDTLGDYFDFRVQTIKEGITKQHTTTLEKNTELHKSNTINKKINNIQGLEKQIQNIRDGIKKLETKRKQSKNRLRNDEQYESEHDERYRQILADTEYELIYDENNISKLDSLRYAIIEQKLDIYKQNPNESFLTVICLELRQHFVDNDIQRFLEQKTISESLNYKTYLQLIEKSKQANKEIHKYDYINDILGQFQGEGEITIEKPTFEEFKNNCPLEYYKTIHTSKGIEFTDSSVPPYISKLIIPGIPKPLYINHTIIPGGERILPEEKTGKRLVIIEKDGTINNKFYRGSTLPTFGDFTFGYASKDSEGNLIIEDSNEKLIETISSQKQEKASNALQISQLYVNDKEMGEIFHSFKVANNVFGPLTEILEKYQSGGVFNTLFASQGEENGIDKEQVNIALKELTKFSGTILRLEGNVEKWKKQKNMLIKIQHKSGLLENEFEHGISQMIQSFDQMIGFYEVKNGTSPAREFVNTLSKINANDTPRKAFLDRGQKNGIKMIAAIAGAVAAIVLFAPTGGASSLLLTSMLGSAGGMVGLRTGTLINEAVHNNFNSRYADGALRFDDPTDIERYLNNQISGKDLFSQLTIEFVKGTLTTMAFIKAGQMIGNSIAKSGNPRMIRFQRTVNRFMGNGNTRANQNAVNGFGKKFSKEFSEEMRQESLEGIGEGVHPVLGGIITIMSCLGGPGYTHISNTYQIGGGITVFNDNSQSAKQIFSYDKKKGNDTQELKNYREAQGLNVTENNGIITAKQTLDKPINTQQGNTIKTLTYEYVPSNASQNTNNMTDILSEYDMKIDHNATDAEGNSINQVLYPSTQSQTEIEEIQTTLLATNTGTITQNSDGSFSLHTTQETIHFKASTEVKRKKEAQVETQESNSIKQDQETEQSIKEIESDQNIFKKPTELEEAQTTKEKISSANKIKAKLFELAAAWSVGSEYDLALKATNLVVKNVEHFFNEFTTIFGIQLFDLYGTFIEMKNHKGQPGDAQFQKLFQKKATERGANITKLFGVGALAKIGIDPHLFFRSGHLVAEQLQKHITFFDKIFGISFDTMDSLYGWKEGNRTNYNPEQVIVNSKLDDATKKEFMTDILKLDPNNPEHQELLDTLIEAHKIREGEAGKNPEYSAGVYNYTTAQIRAKYALLKPFINKGIVTHTEVKFLFDMGFLGSKPEFLQKQSESLQNNKQILKDISEKVKKQEQLKNPKAKKMREFLERINNNTYKMKDGVFESLEGLRNTFKKTLTMPEILVLWQTIAQANNIDMNEQLNVQGVLTEMGFQKQLAMEYQADIEPVDIDAYKKQIPKNMTPEQKIKFANIMANVEQYLSSIEQNNGFISHEHKQRMRKVAASYASSMLMSSFNSTLNNEGLFKKLQEFSNNLIFQTIGDKLIMAGSDHGIKHVTNDAFGGLKLIELLQENHLFENDMNAIDAKVMLIQIIMDHDMGYNMKFFEKISDKLGNGEITDRFKLIDALTDHPVFSAGRVAQNRAKYESIYGDKFTIMMDAMIDHSDVRVEYGPSDNPKSTLFTKEMDFATKLKLMISIPDCLAAFRGDKGWELWSSPVMMNHLHQLNQFNRVLEDVQKMIESEHDPVLKEKLLQQELSLKEKKNAIKQEMIHDIEKVTTDPKKQKQYKQALENSFDVGDIKYPTKYNFGSYTGDIAGGGLQNSLNLVPVKSESGEIIGYKPSVEVNIYQDTMRNVGNAESKKVATSSINKIMDDFGIQEIRDKVDSIDSKTGETTKVFPEMKIIIDGKEKVIKNGEMFYDELTNQSNLGKTIQIEGPSMIFNLTLQKAHPESAAVNQNMEKRIHLDNINNNLLGKDIFSNRETDFRDENGNQNRKKQMTQQVKGLKISNLSVLNMIDNIDTKMQKRANESNPSIKSTLEADAKISINELTIEVLNTTNDNIDIK